MKQLSPYVIQQSPQEPEAKTPILPNISKISPVEDLHFWDYWQVVKKHRWLIAVSFLATVLITAFSVLRQAPFYTAETALLIERRQPQVLGIQGVMPEGYEWDEYDYYRTQYEILKSESLAAQVIQEQGLHYDPAFVGKKQAPGLLADWRAKFSQLWTGVSSQEAQPDLALVSSPEFASDAVLDLDLVDDQGPAPDLIGTYTAMLQVKPVRRTRLVKVAFQTPDPDLSARLANAHAETYIRRGMQLRTQAGGEAERFLEEKLVELKERLEKSEASLNTYRRDKQIISLDDKENIVVERLADLNRRLTEAEAERIGLEAEVRLIRERAYDSLPAVISNKLIGELKHQAAQIEGEYAKLKAQFKPGYPRLTQLGAQLKETQQRIRHETQSVVQGIESAYLAAEAKENELRAKMEEQKATTLGLKDASVQYAILEREADTNRQLYDNVLQRMKEMGIVAELRASNVFVIDKARPPLGPAGPQKSRSLVLAAFIGSFGGIGFAFFLEYLDNTFKSPQEIERTLQSPNLSVIPDFQRVGGRTARYAPITGAGRRRRTDSQVLEVQHRGKETWRASLDTEVSVVGPDLVLSQHPFSAVTESYRTLRTALLLSRAGEPPRTLLFTSGSQGEGKTTTAANMAVMFAQMGEKVLLIDADLRLPDCHILFGLDNGPGLTECLTNQKSQQKAIQPTPVKNLFLLPSGAQPPNPTELIGSQKMYDMLGDLQKRFAYILIDAPPVIPVSDALPLATMVDGVVFVISGQSTSKQVAKQAYQRLSSVPTKILGTVLNRVDVRNGYYHDYYSRSNAYYYRTAEGRATVEMAA